MDYKVKYKKIGQLWWKTLSHVKGDGFIPDNKARYFIMADESRMEIPTENTVFVFDSARSAAIKISTEVPKTS